MQVSWVGQACTDFSAQISMLRLAPKHGAIGLVDLHLSIFDLNHLANILPCKCRPDNEVFVVVVVVVTFLCYPSEDFS